MKYFITSKLSENISETPEGFLLCLNVPIARTGEMIYGPGESPIQVGPDGKAIVSREAKEVFRPETIASFEGKPFTIKHPEDFVNPSNWKVLAKGHLQNVRQGSGANEGDLMADILITDADAIALVKAGVREVSCGYECEYVELGVGRGMQTNIIGNHLALVEAGRAGAAYAINDQQGAKMKTLGEKIKGIFAKAGDEAAKVVDESSKEDKATETKTGGEEVPKWAKDFMTTVKDAMTQIASMSQPSKMGDDDKEDKEDKAGDDKADGDKEDKESKDADMPPWADKLMKDVAALGQKVADLMGEEEEAGDEEGEEEESEDDDFEESPAASVGDEKSRIEILVPGFKASGKDAKRQVLIEAYKSKDTKAVIDRLNGGKAVDLKKASSKTIDNLFIGASEVVGLYRTKSFAKLKQARDSEGSETQTGPMTADKINEINEKHYAQKGVH